MLDQIQRIHIIGISGTLMGNLALFLQKKGIHVSGSDTQFYPPIGPALKDASIEVFSQYHQDNLKNLTQRPDLVLVGNVIRRDNPEVQEAMQGGYRVLSAPEFFEKNLLQNTKNLVVSGTHGKTTTSALLSYVMKGLGQKIGHLVGGIVDQLGAGFQVDDHAEYFVLEGDEYDTAFWDKVPKFFHYLPNYAILTSVEYDHADIYADEEAVIQAFEGLIQRLRSPGGLVVASSIRSLERLKLGLQETPVWTYGLDSNSDYYVQNIRVTSKGSFFDIYSRADDSCKANDVFSPLFGTFNLENILAVWVLTVVVLKLDPKKIQSIIAEFKGAKRRQEVLFENKDYILIEDFAHHPTAVEKTLESLKLRFPERRIVALFEPRSATSRRNVFQKDFVKSFEKSDLAFIAEAYDQKNIPLEKRFSSELLVSDLSAQGRKAFLLKENTAWSQVHGELKPQDVVVLFSNGAFWGIAKKIKDNLSMDLEMP